MVSIRGSKYKWPRDWHAQPPLIRTSQDISWRTGNSELGRVESARCRGLPRALESAVSMDHKGTRLARLLRCEKPWQPPVTLPPVIGCHLRLREVQWSVSTTQQQQPGHLSEVPALLGCSVRALWTRPQEEAEVQKWEGRDPNKKWWVWEGFWFEKKTHVGINES